MSFALCHLRAKKTERKVRRHFHYMPFGGLLPPSMYIYIYIYIYTFFFIKSPVDIVCHQQTFEQQKDSFEIDRAARHLRHLARFCVARQSGRFSIWPQNRSDAWLPLLKLSTVSARARDPTREDLVGRASLCDVMTSQKHNVTS